VFGVVMNKTVFHLFNLTLPPFPPQRIATYLEKSFPTETTLVADIAGKIAGFGAIVEDNDEVRAVYVNAAYSRKGVGSALIKELENIAKSRGCKELRLDASLTAVNFYKNNGYEELERAQHSLISGRQMACVKMRKVLTA